MIFAHGYWIWYLILLANVFCWGEIALAVITVLRSHFTKKILLVPGILAILTAIVHSYTLRSWRRTVVHRALVNYPQVIFSHTLVVFNGILAAAWFTVSILMYIFASTLPRYSAFLYNIPPILFWLIAFAAYMLFVIEWTLCLTGVYYRHRFLKRSQRAQGYKPPRKLLSATHMKWIMASILLSMVTCTIDMGVSLGDGWYGAYSLWLIQACTGITLLFQFTTLYMWRKTAKQRWGSTTIPLSISSITLPILLFPLACLWSATAVFAFLVAARKYSVLRYIRQSTKYRRYTVFRYTRWVAAGLALLVALLLWLEFALVVYSRVTYAKRVANTMAGAGGAGGNAGGAGSGSGGGGTGYDARKGAAAAAGTITTNTTTTIHPELVTAGSSGSMMKTDVAVPTPPPSYLNENNYPVNNAYPVNNLYPVNNTYPVNNMYPVNNTYPVNNAYPVGQTNSVYNPVYQPPTVPPPSAPAPGSLYHPPSVMNPMYQKDEGKA